MKFKLHKVQRGHHNFPHEMTVIIFQNAKPKNLQDLVGLKNSCVNKTFHFEENFLIAYNKFGVYSRRVCQISQKSGLWISRSNYKKRMPWSENLFIPAVLSDRKRRTKFLWPVAPLPFYSTSWLMTFVCGKRCLRSSEASPLRLKLIYVRPPFSTRSVLCLLTSVASTYT